MGKQPNNNQQLQRQRLRQNVEIRVIFQQHPIQKTYVRYEYNYNNLMQGWLNFLFPDADDSLLLPLRQDSQENQPFQFQPLLPLNEQLQSPVQQSCQLKLQRRKSRRESSFKFKYFLHILENLLHFGGNCGISFSTLIEKISDVFFDLEPTLKKVQKNNLLKNIRRRLYDSLNCMQAAELLEFVAIEGMQLKSQKKNKLFRMRKRSERKDEEKKCSKVDASVLHDKINLGAYLSSQQIKVLRAMAEQEGLGTFHLHTNQLHL